MGQGLKLWGKQDTICPTCNSSATHTYATVEDDVMSESYCIRYFERLCAVCDYWSGWIWVNNGEIKIPIGIK